jgi:hypothetical protein
MARAGARSGPSSMMAECGRRLGCFLFFLLMSGESFHGKTSENQVKRLF